MTFLSNVLTKDDPNNSYSGTTNSYNGNPTDTTGYNTLIINVITTSNSIAGGLQIKFSSTGTDFDNENTTYYRDTVFGTSNSSGSGSGFTFIKTYPILKQYYRVRYESESSVSLKITSRLSTESYTNNQNSISAFNNEKENIIDAFGKLRVSNPQTLLDLRVPGQDASGNGTKGATAYMTNNIQICYDFSGVSLDSSGYKICSNSQMDIYVSGNGTFTNQSRKYCTYQPGKSLLIMMSGIMDASTALGYRVSGNASGIKSRLGYYDKYNGLYYEYIASGGGTGTCNINIIQNSTLTTISQTNWNIDKMDGNGISGLKLDWTKAQLFVIDLEWLGVGRIRFGFYAYGKIQYCHEITNINSISLGPYTYNINLPIRSELVGVVDGSGSMIQICSTVISEGGYTPIGRPFTKSITKNSITNGDNYLLYLRGGNSLGNYYHQQILPTDLTFASSSVNDVGILTVTLYLPPLTFSSTITWSDVNTNYSVCQYGTTTGTIGAISSPGIILYESAISGRGSVNFSDLGQTFNDIMQITSDISNTSSIIAISVNGTFGGSSTIYCTLSWVEIY
jgi:hypothetical protein